MEFIHKISKAYSKNSCNKLIKWFEDNSHLATPGAAGEKKINNLEIRIEINESKDFFGLGKTLYKSIDNFKKKYNYVDKHIYKWQLNKFMRLMKYEPNNYYNFIHCENDGNKNNLKRVFAFMIFLNDIKKGGGTKFIFQKFTAKPLAGDLYIWPAYWTHLHQGINAPNENKYMITGWVSFI
tara:strand:+ start:70 stop:612 length:543 start_codon:yes stop_codon:yes gene_type:complete